MAEIYNYNKVFKTSAALDGIKNQLDGSPSIEELNFVAEKLHELGKDVSDEIRSEYQTLCGRVHTMGVNQTVEEIGLDAEAGRLDDLTERIKEVRYRHALSLANRKILATAEKYLEGCARRGQIEKAMMMPEVAMEIFEIAEAVYNGNDRRARELMITLGDSHKKRLDSLTKEYGDFVKGAIAYAEECVGLAPSKISDEEIAHMLSSKM